MFKQDIVELQGVDLQNNRLFPGEYVLTWFKMVGTDVWFLIDQRPWQPAEIIEGY